MTREIKFRAWEKPDKSVDFTGKMLEWSPSFFGDCVFGLQSDDYIPMQFTGLKDKNGVEIFEGDMVKEKNDSMIWCVEFSEEYCSYILQNPHDKNNVNTFDWLITNQWKNRGKKSVIEIIGNIYQNPELLK